MNESELKVLSKGLDYCIFPQSVNIIHVQTEFENLYQELRPALSQKKRKEFKRILLNLCNKYVSSFFYLRKHSDANLLPEEKEALENLKKDNTIVICKPDKTKRVTILNKSDYIGKMEDILNDHKTFKKVPCDDNIGNLQKFQQFLYRLKKNGC